MFIIWNLSIYIMDDYEDVYELEQDADYKGTRTPVEIMDHKFNVVYNRDWKRYLDSIEWDTWLKPLNPIELAKILKQQAIDNHPFNKFF